MQDRHYKQTTQTANSNNIMARKEGEEIEMIQEMEFSDSV